MDSARQGLGSTRRGARHTASTPSGDLHRRHPRRLRWAGLLGLLVAAAPAVAQAPDPDLNDDGVVNILDVSLVSSCFGQTPVADCAVADTDGDGDVDMDDLNYVVAVGTLPSSTTSCTR